MPLPGFPSLCGRTAPRIVSRDKGHPQQHIAHNPERAEVSQYRIDGVVLTTGKRCDFLLLQEKRRAAYLIELKGQDLSLAALQLRETEKALSGELAQYPERYYRIVAHRSKTHQIESASFKKYREAWGKRLKYASIQIEETI